MVSTDELMALLNCDGWNIDQENIKNLLLEGNKLNIQQAKNEVLNSDLKDIGTASLHEDLIKGKKTSLPGPLILQVTKMRNVSAPKAFEESGGAPRMLKVFLTDGFNTVQGLEVQCIKTLSLKTAPGTKVRLNGKVPVSGGFLLLTPHNISVVGGIVQELYDKWNLSVSVSKYSRGVSTADGSGPPPWVPFGKCIIKNHMDMQKFKSLKDLEGKEKADGDFENQRKQAVRELSKEGTLKVFGGGKQMLDANVQKIINAGFSLDVAEWALMNSKNDPVKAIKELRAAANEPECNNYGDEGKKRSIAGHRGRGGRGHGREKGKGVGPDDTDDYFDPTPNMPRPSGPASLFDFFDSRIVEKKEPVNFVEPVADVRGSAYNEMGRRNDQRDREKGYQKGHRNQRGFTSSRSITQSAIPPDMTVENWPAPGEENTTSSTRSYLESRDLMERKEKQENSLNKPPMQTESSSAQEYFLNYKQNREQNPGRENARQNINASYTRDLDYRVGNYARKDNIRRGGTEFHTQEIDSRRGCSRGAYRIMGKFNYNSSNRSLGENNGTIDNHYEDYRGGREKCNVIHFKDGNYSESLANRHRDIGNSYNGNRGKKVNSAHYGDRYNYNGKNQEMYCNFDKYERGSNWNGGRYRRSTEYTAKELDMIQDFQQSMAISGHQGYDNMAANCGRNEGSSDYSNFVGTLEFHRGGRRGGRRGRGSYY